VVSIVRNEFANPFPSHRHILARPSEEDCKFGPMSLSRFTLYVPC